jgi:hypothetical protein
VVILTSRNDHIVSEIGIITANERSLHYSDVAKIIDQLQDAMCDEDESRIRQLLIAAPLDYQPKNVVISTENHNIAFVVMSRKSIIIRLL